ncbi:MAG: helix-turn-helix domain-containing protein [Nanoarchaeota archaeon]|nr:helix-turn-helix domain-containing protein [Nanoarchaeota archaeon]
MTKDEIINLLKIGLTEGEAKVYLALVELGSSTVGPIVKKSKVAYSNIYDILNRLIDKGIVSFIVKQKTKYFTACSPSNILDYLDKKEKEILNQKDSFRKILPELEKLQETKENQEAEIFTGIRGLKTAYEKMFRNLGKNDETLFFYIHDEKYSEEADLFYHSTQELYKGKKNRGIANKECKNSWHVKKAKYLQTKFVNFPIPGNIDIINNYVFIVSWSPTITGILINSKSIAENLRNYFNQIWEIAV